MYTSFPIMIQLFGPSLKNLLTGFIQDLSSNSLIKTDQVDVPTRSFCKATQYLFIYLRLYIIFHKLHSTVKYLQDLEVYLYEIRNGRQISSLGYAKALFNQWKCEQCTNRTMLQPVCHNRNCSAGFFPVYISRGCYWICQLCYPGFIKSNEGQHGCSKCPTNSIPNKNQTKCLEIQYHYFIISDLQQLTVIALSSIGIVYTLCFLAVFLFHRSTPIAKSSNLRLSVPQIILHLILSIHLPMTILEQKEWICFMHSIIGRYLLQLIMSIYIVKTFQLLTTFQSNVKIKKTAGLTLKEAAFPVVYNAASIFVDVIYLALYHNYEYGIYQTNGSLFIYNYCDMTSYFILVQVLLSFCQLDVLCKLS